jgi:hypothetical protein
MLIVPEKSKLKDDDGDDDDVLLGYDTVLFWRW